MMARKLNDWFTIAVVLVLLFAYSQPRRAYACSCAYDPNLSDEARLLENFQRAHNELVLVGRVVGSELIQQDTTFSSSADPVYVTFAVETVYKGEITADFTLTTAAQSASCGYGFVEGMTYLVFAGDDYGDGSWNTGLCSGNVVEPTADFLAVLGEGNPPALGVTGSPNDAGLGWVIALAVALVAIGGLAYWRRRRGMVPLLLIVLLLGSVACGGVVGGRESLAVEPAVAEPAAELVGVTWQLVAAGEEASDMFLPQPAATLRFTADQFEGDSGCNRLFGRYAAEAGRLKMEVGQTKRGCATDLATFESWLVTILRSEPTFSLASDAGQPILTIQQPDDVAGRLVFRGMVQK